MLESTVTANLYYYVTWTEKMRLLKIVHEDGEVLVIQRIGTCSTRV